MILQFGVLINLMFVTICFRSVNFTALQISPYNVDYQWEQIQKVLEGQPITSIMFDRVLVCEVGVAKILNYTNVVDSLRSLKFNHVFGFNSDVMKAIWQSKPATLLKNLTIDVSNVENKDLAYWPTDKELALENLSLEQNFIGSEGFNLLSKTKMNNLVNLNIYKNSLVDDESIDSILKLNLSKLQKLNIGYTSISQKNTLKLLSSLNLSTLTTLNISTNNFQQQFYLNFSKYNFNSLQQLDLSQLLIDEDGIKYFKNMKFPSLRLLSIGGNYCFGEGLYTFLRRVNYPEITSLVVDGGVFGDGFFRYFAKEFQRHLFQILVLNGRGISSDIFYHLKTLNLTKIRKFVVMNGYMKPQLINDFMDANQFEQLQKLALIGLKNTGQLLHKIMDKKWPKLRMLYLGRVGKINMTRLQQQSKTIRFPMLQHILINLHGYNPSQICQYLNLTSSTSPTPLRIQLSTAHPFKLIQTLTSPQIKFNNQILLQIQSQNKIIFKCMLNPHTQPYIYYFPINHALESQYTYMTTSQEYEDNQEYVQFRESRWQEYQVGFWYGDVDKLEDQGDCMLVGMLRDRFLDEKRQCIFPNVRALILQKITNQCYTKLSECKFPNIIQLSISIKNLTCFQPNNTHQFKPFLPNNLSQIIEITLIDEQYIPNNKVIQFFKTQKFQCLYSVYIMNSDLKSQQINIILNSSKGIKRIKRLGIVLTWINNIQFINNYDFVLQALDLSGEMIGNSIQKLSGIRYQFVNYLRLAGDAIKDEQFGGFVERVKNGSKGDAFPKLTSAVFFKNQIQMGGTLKLFQAGVPYLEKVNFLVNKNPGIINQILGSSLHRLTQLLTYQNDDDSIDPNLPQKSSKQIQLISLQSTFLSISDFQSLSRLQFPSLSTLQIQFRKDFDCNMFPPILSLSKNIDQLNLQFSPQILEISSQCLQNSKIKSDTSVQHLNTLILISQNKYYSNLRKLFNFIVFNQEIIVLVIQGVYPEENVLRNLAMLGNLEYLEKLEVRSNGLGDQIVFLLLNRDFREIQIIDLSHNHLLTSAAIKSMTNRTYPQLNSLILDSTQINDTTIQTLLTCNFPSLISLSLCNTNITGKSMELLSELKAPYLRNLDISNSNLRYQDISGLKVQNFPKLVQIIVYPYKTQKQKKSLQQIFNRNRNKNYQIQIQCDVMYYEIISGEGEGEGGGDEGRL